MKRTAFILFAFLALIASGCHRDGYSGAGRENGAFTLKVAVAPEVKAGAADSDDLLQSAVVSIYNGDFSGLVRQYRYSELPSVIYLPSGSYRVDVSAGEWIKESPQMASWDKKSYKGSSNVDISDNTVQTVEITAGIVNVVACVTFDASIAQVFDGGYSFDIGLSEGLDDASFLTYTAGNSGAEGYLVPSGEDMNLYWRFSGTIASSGEPFTRSGKILGVERGKLYKMSPKYTLRDGDVSDLSLYLSTDVEEIEDIIVFDGVSTGVVASAATEIWAGHADVHASVDENQYGDPAKIKFVYTCDGGVEQVADSQRDGAGSYSGVLTGLKPDTDCTYCLSIDGVKVGTPLKIHTEKAPQLPNSGFEVTSNDESSKWDSFFSKSASDPLCRTKFWDHGSSASTTAGSSYAICYSDTDVPSGIGSTKSARLQSRNVIIKFAAGNLFAGEYAETIGTKGGKVNFGRPWTSRPTKVRFWYKYKGGKVDCAESGAPLKDGDYDQCAVKVALGTWSASKYGGSADCPVQVNTTDKSTFWNYPELDETIAYAEHCESADKTPGVWTQVTLELNYKNMAAYPKFIVVSCAASRYGDYFTGCSSSALYLDNFELLYE